MQKTAQCHKQYDHAQNMFQTRLHGPSLVQNLVLATIGLDALLAVYITLYQDTWEYRSCAR